MVEKPDYSPDANQLPLRQSTIGAKEVQTSLPEGVDIYFPATAGDISLMLKVDQIDDLPVGRYQTTFEWSALRDPDNPDSPTSGTENQFLEVMQTDKGKAVTMFEFGEQESGYPIPLGRKSLYEQLGYVTKMDDDQCVVIAYPTPQTLVRTAQDFGVSIYLATEDDLIIGTMVDDSGDIESIPYLTAFKNGQYPISAYSEYSYTHDADQTHLMGIIFGGEELMSELSLAADRALTDPSRVSDTTGGIDGITAGLQRYLVAGSSRQRAEGEGAFKYYATQLGITDEKSDVILRAAERRAQILGS